MTETIAASSDLTPKQVADALGCSQRTVLRRIALGHIPALRPWPGAPYVVARTWVLEELARRSEAHVRLARLTPEERRDELAKMASKASVSARIDAASR